MLLFSWLFPCTLTLFLLHVHVCEVDAFQIDIHTSGHGGIGTKIPVPSAQIFPMRRETTGTQLSMGVFDFFKSRKDDFVKLDSSSQSTIGPGPLILMYNMPDGIIDEELTAMIEDGAPIASRSEKGGVAFERIFPSQIRDADGVFSDKSVMEVLQMALSMASSRTRGKADEGNNMEVEGKMDSTSTPILYFSGISNSEMMQTYKIIAREIYEEMGGGANSRAACAKVVEPAFDKPFVQLVEEISGDHSDAIRMNSE